MTRDESVEGQMVIDHIRDAFDDDLDTPKAIAILWEALKPSRPAVLTPDALSTIIAYADQVLGLGLTAYLGKKVRVPAEVQRLVAAREGARVAKDWARADVLRAQIEALGWSVEDTKEGPAAKRLITPHVS